MTRSLPVLAVAALVPSGTAAQEATAVVLGMTVQPRYTHTVADDAAHADAGPAADEVHERKGWSLRRARLKASADPGRKVHAEIELDLADADAQDPTPVKDAFVALRPAKRVELTVGRFKRPFSALQLRSPARLEVAERGPTDELARRTGFAGRDVGAMVAVEPVPGRRKLLTLELGGFRGDHDGADASPAGTVAARATGEPLAALRLGAGAVWRVGGRTAPSYREAGWAYGADARLSWRRLRAQVEVLSGERTDLSAADPRWLGVTLLASYEVPVRGVTLEPALKLEALDADADVSDDARQVLTLALNAYFTPEVRLLVEAERTFVQDATVPVGDRPDQAPDVPAATIITQLQVRI